VGAGEFSKDIDAQRGIPGEVRWSHFALYIDIYLYIYIYIILYIYISAVAGAEAGCGCRGVFEGDRRPAWHPGGGDSKVYEP